jgi:hypothetical protein
VEASSQLLAPAILPPGKELPVPFREEAGWGPESVWTINEKHNFFKMFWITFGRTQMPLNRQFEQFE